MSDTGINAQSFQPQQVPQQMASLGDAFGALEQPVTAPVPAPGPQFVSSPVPAVPPNITDVSQITKDWHKDPVKQGVSQGFVSNYAKQMPGGLGQAAQHLNTFKNLIESGQLADTGDDKGAHRLWSRFQNNPERMSSADSALLAEHLRTVGNATSQSPDLRFDPIGRVGKVGADGSVRVDYPPVTRAADLDLRPLAVAGLDNLRRMASIGEGANPGQAGILDVLPAFLGLNPQDRPNAQGHTDLAAALDVLARETGSNPQQIAANVAAGWDSLAPTDVPWRKPWALSIDGPNPAAEALDGRLSSKVVGALGQGVSELDFSGGKNLSVTSTANGGLAVSGNPNIKNGRLLRHLYPAFTKDGTTAWLPGVPAKTSDVTRLVGETSVYNGPIMDALGGHPGLIPGDHVIFDAPARFKSPVQAMPLGNVMSRKPKYVMDRLGLGDINEDEFTTPKSVLSTNAWALIPGGNNLKVALTQKGFKPIEHTIGNQTHQLVFGITPEQAQKMTTQEVVTNAGTWTKEGFRPGDGISFSKPNDGVPSVSHLFTSEASWHLAGVNRDDPATDNPGTVQTQVRAQRQVATLDPSQVADLSGTLTSLQQAGATSMQVYSHRDVINGYKTAYEHIFTDGQNYATHLSPVPSAAGHVVPVFVPSTTHVPDLPVQAPTLRYGNTGAQLNGVSVLTPDKLTKLTDLKQRWISADGDALIPSDTQGDGEIVGNRLRVKDPSTGGAAVIRLARLTGMVDSNIQAPLPDKMETTDRSKAITISGIGVPELRRTQPNPDWAAQHGVEFDPAWRTYGKVQALDPAVQAAMSIVFGRYTEQHADAHKMWNVPRIAMTSGYADSPAYTEWGKLGGSIGLSVKHYSEPEQLAYSQLDHARTGVTALRKSAQVLTALAYPLAHELGHTVHGALQFGSDESGAKAELLALRKRLGTDGIRTGLSALAVHSPEEMVAESVASGLTGNPGPVARDVIKIVTSALSRVQAARAGVNW